MQIQPPTAASVAAGNVSQATSRDRTTGGTAEAAHVSTAIGIERVARSEATSADRDAQGGGQGLDARGEQALESAVETPVAAIDSGLSVRPPEPPSELDIVG